ncbi:hypothetical protein BKA57DRAFT_453607 [Linnemannia elongata]|nr:hypothetical protein BKA57DRAFT_453607 [Linnemannia elongata]
MEPLHNLVLFGCRIVYCYGVFIVHMPDRSRVVAALARVISRNTEKSEKEIKESGKVFFRIVFHFFIPSGIFLTLSIESCAGVFRSKRKREGAEKKQGAAVRKGKKKHAKKTRLSFSTQLSK